MGAHVCSLLSGRSAIDFAEKQGFFFFFVAQSTHRHICPFAQNKTSGGLFRGASLRFFCGSEIKPARACHGRLNLFGRRAQKKKMASSHTRHFKALTMHARKTRTAPPHRTFPPLFLAFRNALRSHALTRLRARTTNTHTTTHTCTLLCLFSREQATSLHVCRQCRTACFCRLINSGLF